MNVLVAIIDDGRRTRAISAGVTREIAASGQVLEIGKTPSERVVAAAQQIAPGAPPLLAFRYYDAQTAASILEPELMLDDAGTKMGRPIRAD